MRRGAGQIVRELTQHGLRFTRLELRHVGIYGVSDADWNYKDVPHLNEIHGLVDAVLADVREDSIATINLQKVLGVSLPIVVYNYAQSEGTQIYFSTLLVFVLVIETRFAAVGDAQTEVTTTYWIGARRPFNLLAPAVKAVLRRNYANLMSGDVPMRERRGWLRGQGHAFVGDGEPHSYLRTMNLSATNVVPPPCPVGADVGSVRVPPVAVEVDQFWGQPDAFGLRIRVERDRVVVFPRTCMHEGAPLDAATCARDRLRCPWHGRSVPPLAVLDRPGGNEREEVVTERHRISLCGDMLDIAVITPDPAL